MNIDKMCHLSCRAQRRTCSHPLMFWRFDDARVFGWVDTDDADQARAQAVEDLDKRGWDVRHFEFVTVFTPSSPKLSKTNAVARARGGYYDFLRWYVRPEGQAVRTISGIGSGCPWSARLRSSCSALGRSV